MNFTRRDALRLGLAGALFPWGQAARADSCAAHGQGGPPQPIQTVYLSPEIPRFERPFNHLKPLTKEDLGGLDGYRIKMQKTEVEILPGKKTPVWTYNSELPGPLIRQQKNVPSVVRFENYLGNDDQGKPIDSVIHLHGVASLPQYDGYAEDIIPPGHYKDYYYPNDKAASFWYHDHAIEKTSRNVYMGLASMYLVDYDDEDFIDPASQQYLPQGEYDIPMIIQDKRLTPDGELLFYNRQHRGVYGDVVLVNGVPWPRLQVKNRRYRFRILNGGTSRTLNLEAWVKHDDDTREPVTLQVVASDSGLLEAPAPTKTLTMGVAERYEVVIDFGPYAGKEVIITNPIFFGNLDSDISTTEIMCCQVEPGAADNPPLPQQLGVLTPMEILESEVERTRTFRFENLGGRWLINGRRWDPNYVAAHLNPCATEVWRFESTGGWVHPIHVHLGHFRLRRRSRLPIPAYARGMKDTFWVTDFETVEMIGRFGPHEGKYMMHCHNLVHEDHDMMTQFEVGDRGCEPCAEPARAMPAPAGFDAPQCVPPEEC